MAMRALSWTSDPRMKLTLTQGIVFDDDDRRAAGSRHQALSISVHALPILTIPGMTWALIMLTSLANALFTFSKPENKTRGKARLGRKTEAGSAGRWERDWVKLFSELQILEQRSVHDRVVKERFGDDIGYARDPVQRVFVKSWQI